jgi:polysaccharide export outer membrane protein
MKPFYSLLLPGLLLATLPANPLWAQSAQESPYLLGTNDEVQVIVYGQPDYSIKTRIKSDGTISLPYIGTVSALGKSTSDLGASVAGALRGGGYFTNPSVNVEVVTFVSKSVTVLGNVLTPGIYALDRPLTIAMVVARAGGVRAGGADAVVISRADGSPQLRVSLAAFGPQDGANLTLTPGDTLFVPPAELIYVYGQVNTPGAFAFQAGMTYRQALARAGGPTLAGSTRKIEVRRGDKKLTGIGLDQPIQPEDVLIIKERLF